MNNPKSDPIDFIKFLGQYYSNIDNLISFFISLIMQSGDMGMND